MKQEIAHKGVAESERHDLDRARNLAADVERSHGNMTAPPPLPKPGETFTEAELSERFGVDSSGGGIRTSKISSDIILVSRVDVPTPYQDEESGEYVYFDGVDRSPDQMTFQNKALNDSAKNGRRVLYFVKEYGKLAFHGRVECVDWKPKDPNVQGGMITFKMRRIIEIDTKPDNSTKYAMVVKIDEDEDGGYVATVPELPGCISQGETRTQARENLEEAISLYLEYMLESGMTLPPGLTSTLDVAAINVRGESVSAKISDVPGCMSP